MKKHKTNIILDKPIYVGASVLDISKWLMYHFHYNFIKKIYPGAKLCFSNTDSLLYEIPGEDCNGDLYVDIYKHRSWFDLSDVKGKFNDNTNKKVIGKIKDELCFEPIVEFIGLRPKMYSVLALNNTKNMMKAKGVKKAVVKKNFNHALYQSIVLGAEKNHTAVTTEIRSNRHRITTEQICKSELVNFDDKHYCQDGIITRAIGHYKTKRFHRAI